MTARRPTVAVVAGTRPEAIKVAPLVTTLRREDSPFDVRLVATGQHRDMFGQALSMFGLEADDVLDVMRPNQLLAQLTARILTELTGLWTRARPDWVVVQGDTTSAMAGFLAAFYLRIPVAHVEAGLRTGDLRQPFPEELNRAIVDCGADLLFAPTPRAAAVLQAQGVPSSRVVLTGNTGIDALMHVMRLPQTPYAATLGRAFGNRPMAMVTMHRRENHGAPLSDVCRALRTLAERRHDLHFLVPVHRNPNVADLVWRELGGHPSFFLTDPLGYRDFVAMMQRAALILTDSGGVQEEAPSLGTPVLILRETTERPEAVACGAARLVGCDPGRIVHEAEDLLDDVGVRPRILAAGNPFGDGQASARIVDALMQASRSA